MSGMSGMSRVRQLEIRPFRAERIRPPLNVAAFEVPSPSIPLDVEVGCGAGFHPLRYATSHPERFLVAIEHTRTRFERFAGRIAHHPALPNLFPVHADAVAWVTHFLPPASVDRYFFLYPNPYPKGWHVMPFFGRVVETLKPGGTIVLATNEGFYFKEAKEYLVGAWGLEIQSEQELSVAAGLPFGIPRTHFEKKYLARGETCFDLVARKGV
jgi:tRNA (guanine-N7-)-methyltransferase